MPLLSYNRLSVEVVDANVLHGVPTLDNINGSSIDITLGSGLLIEDIPELVCPNCHYTLPKQSSYEYRRQISRSYRNDLVHCCKCNESSPVYAYVTPVDFSKKEPLAMCTVDCNKGYTLWPGEVCLGHTVEVFNLPAHITAEYRLKSSMARVFLEHLHAGWCDPMWTGSQLTLEFKNETQYHPLLLTSGMKCGQVCFYDHEPVPESVSYAKRGQYNNQRGATASRGMK